MSNSAVHWLLLKKLCPQQVTKAGDLEVRIAQILPVWTGHGKSMTAVYVATL